MPPQYKSPQQILIPDHTMSPSQSSSMSTAIVESLKAAENDIVALKDQGYPGYLTQSEFEILSLFRKEVFRREQDFRDTVFSFRNANEDEVYALCRWLRARKYDLSQTIQMVEEATDCSAQARKNNFYPSASTALGCDASLYMQQYPQVYYGHAKNGCPIFYSKPAMIDINAIESLTSLQGIVNFHWNDMMHKFVQKLKNQYTTSKGEFKRYECICVLDLNNLSSAQLSKRPMKIIKEQSAIDSLCFPETLNRMVIVNSPAFFTFTWKIIRSWIDQRTANKVSVIGTNKDYMLKHLTEIIDKSQLPTDYGGIGPSIDAILQEEMVRQYSNSSSSNSTALSSSSSPSLRLTVKKKDTSLISLRGKSCESITVGEGRIVKAFISTRSVDGATLSIRGDNGKQLPAVPQGGITIKHGVDDENELPTSCDLEESYGIVLEGPGRYDFEFDSLGSRLKTVYIVLATAEFTQEQVHDPANDASMRKAPQAGNDCDNNSILLSSHSLCSGTYAENLDDVLLMIKPTPRTRKDKKIFISTTEGVNSKYETASPNNMKNINGMHCSLSTTYSESPNSQSSGCGFSSPFS
mmetsp:Transcript_4012/g.5822  ORF Transcript_4012/g.5822 Transcript_4012/m.5822 type:complete len:580 (+) Transcript_4012:87-1826(+)